MLFFSDEANEAADASDMILKIHVSRFADDVDDFGGFIEYHEREEDPFCPAFPRTPLFLRPRGQEESAVS